MIGSTLLRHLLPGTEEARSARELRRDYLYVIDTLGSRTPAQIRASRDELLQRDVLAHGEMEASKRMLDRAGIPRDPPADWQPDDPEHLMTAYERELFRARKAELVRQFLPAPAGDAKE